MPPPRVSGRGRGRGSRGRGRASAGDTQVAPPTQPGIAVAESSEQDAQTGLSMDQLLALIRAEVENSTRQPTQGSAGQGRYVMLYVRVILCARGRAPSSITKQCTVIVLGNTTE